MRAGRCRKQLGSLSRYWSSQFWFAISKNLASLSNQAFRVPDLTFKLLQPGRSQAINCKSHEHRSLSQIPSTWRDDSLGNFLLVRVLQFLADHGNYRFNQTTLIDTTPLPADIPPVKEIGSSSAPLLSASFFIGARCKSYNDDFMQCKNESPGRGEVDCLKEGRRVTRCARSV